MTPLTHYLQDGADAQPRALMCLLQNFTIEESWIDELKIYEATPQIARWENCREQGYVITLRCRHSDQVLCLAFFQHRNSDSLCALKWEQQTLNSPTIDNAQFSGQCYRDKWDVSHQVGYGEICQMADWLMEQMRVWWLSKNKPTTDE